MKNDPVSNVKWINSLLLVTLIALSIVSEMESLQLMLGLIFLVMSMSFVSAAIKHLAKRIDILEKKLEATKTEKDT